MRDTTKVLAIVDTRQNEHLALERACQICEMIGAELHLLAPTPYPNDETNQTLNQLAHDCAEKDLVVNIHQYWHRSVVDSILHIRNQEHCQLVVKSIKPSSALQKHFSTPEDWSLLRRCKVPVLLVQSSSPWNSSAMLAAVNANPRDHYHRVLNRSILEYADMVRELFDSKMHLATAFPTHRMAIQDHGDGITDQACYTRVAHEYANKHAIADENLHIVAGLPDRVIPHVAQEIDATLVILGTHARSGMSAMTIGNTAEQIISKIKTDMLVLHPKNHAIPLGREL